MKVMLSRDHASPLWCLWWLNPRLYVCGFLTRDRAVAYAARNGWEVAE